MNNYVPKGRNYLDKENEFTICTALWIIIILVVYGFRTTSVLFLWISVLVLSLSLSLFMNLYISFIQFLNPLSLCWCLSPLTIFEVSNYVTCSKLSFEFVEYWASTESMCYLNCFSQLLLRCLWTRIPSQTVIAVCISLLT